LLRKKTKASPEAMASKEGGKTKQGVFATHLCLAFFASYLVFSI
jgi:hypothetical protein